MARQITVLTPENIPLTLELAGLATRLGALLIDVAIQIAAMIVLVIIGAIVAVTMSLTGLGTLGEVLIYLGAFVILFGYFIFFEVMWNGQTPGKRLFGLRVVRDGGFPVNFYCIAVRNIIRVADSLPPVMLFTTFPILTYGFGAASVFFHPQYKRLGDLVAGTLVVKERPVNPLAAFQTDPASAGISGRLPDTIRNPYDVLTPDELMLLRRFALRRYEMTADDGERLAYRLVVPLIPRLNISFLDGVPPRYADLVSVLVRAADEREAELDLPV